MVKTNLFGPERLDDHLASLVLLPPPGQGVSHLLTVVQPQGPGGGGVQGSQGGVISYTPDCDGLIIYTHTLQASRVYRVYMSPGMSGSSGYVSPPASVRLCHPGPERLISSLVSGA